MSSAPGPLVESDRISQVAVVANGEFPHAERLVALLDSVDAIIAADGGGNWLFSVDRAPHLLVGDMDSISSEALLAFQLQGCEIVRHRLDKDETDTELALLAAVDRGATHVLLLGALGGRIDHELANIQLLTMPQLAGTRVRIYDGVSFVSLIHHSAVLHGQPGDLLSLLPWGGDAHGVTTRGLQYPLRNGSLPVGPARGVSNVLLGTKAQVTVNDGRLLAIHTPLSQIGPQAESQGTSET